MKRQRASARRFFGDFRNASVSFASFALSAGSAETIFEASPRITNFASSHSRPVWLSPFSSGSILISSADDGTTAQTDSSAAQTKNFPTTRYLKIMPPC